MQFKLLLLCFLTITSIKSIENNSLQIPGLILYVDPDFIESRSIELDFKNKENWHLRVLIEKEQNRIAQLTQKEQIKYSEELKKLSEKLNQVMNDSANVHMNVTKKIKDIIIDIGKSRGANAILQFYSLYNYYYYISDEYNISQQVLDKLNRDYIL